MAFKKESSGRRPYGAKKSSGSKSSGRFKRDDDKTGKKISSSRNSGSSDDRRTSRDSGFKRRSDSDSPTSERKYGERKTDSDRPERKYGERKSDSDRSSSIVKREDKKVEGGSRYNRRDDSDKSSDTGKSKYPYNKREDSRSGDRKSGGDRSDGDRKSSSLSERRGENKFGKSDAPRERLTPEELEKRRFEKQTASGSFYADRKFKSTRTDNKFSSEDKDDKKSGKSFKEYRSSNKKEDSLPGLENKIESPVSKNKFSNRIDNENSDSDDFAETEFNKSITEAHPQPFPKGRESSGKKHGERNKFSKTNEDPDETNPFSSSETLRLNKFIANAGICSRRQADDHIANGEVTVNGKVVTEMGYRVQKTDLVKFKDQLVAYGKKVYILLNKPKDFLTTKSDEHGRKTVMELIKNATDETVYPVGRLDRNTTGLLLFTNDGELTQSLTHPSYGVSKVYHVTLDKPLHLEDMEKIANGVELEDGLASVDHITYADAKDKTQVGIEIHIGKNRIVRRIFEHLKYDVIKLDRVLYAGISKKDLARGRWRLLTEKEIIQLKKFKELR